METRPAVTSLNSLCGLCGGTSGTGEKKFLQAHWLFTTINNSLWSSIHLATEVIIIGLCEEALLKYVASLHTYNKNFTEKIKYFHTPPHCSKFPCTYVQNPFSKPLSIPVIPIPRMVLTGDGLPAHCKPPIT